MSRFNVINPLHNTSLLVTWLPDSALVPAKAVNAITAQRINVDVIMEANCSGIRITTISVNQTSTWV